MQLVQVGGDPHAAQFLRGLDDNIEDVAKKTAGKTFWGKAKRRPRDIVDTYPFNQGDPADLPKVLKGAMNKKFDWDKHKRSNSANSSKRLR